MQSIVQPYLNYPDPQIALDIRPVAGRIGAEIAGVRLGADMDDTMIAAIRAALVRHKVIFFRAQTQLDDQGQEDFTERLGSAVKHPTVPVAEGSNFLLELGPEAGFGASSWHTDVTFVPAYPEASILRCLIAPEAGGDTMWANTVTAYETLPEALRTLCDDLRAVHCNDFAMPETPEVSAEQRERNRKLFSATIFRTEQPVVRVHPESGERSLVLGHFFEKFVGMDSATSAQLYDLVQRHIEKPENTVRWRWSVGDVAIWDNRATQHRSVADFGKQNRVLRRSTLNGDVSLGIDGRPARMLMPA